MVRQRGETGIKGLLEYTNGIVATLREPFLVLDKKLRIISTNHAFYTTFKVTEKNTIGELLPDLGNRQWNIPELLQLLKEIILEKKVVKDYEVEHKFERIGQRTISLNARHLRIPKQVAGIAAAGVREEELVLLAIEDVTERKRLQAELKESEERYRRAFETSQDGLLFVHKTKGSILDSNESIQELLGYSSAELSKKKLWEIGIVKDDKDFQETVSRLERDGVIHYEDTPVETKKDLSINSEVFLLDKAKVIQCNIRDITELKEEEESFLSIHAQLKGQKKALDQFAIVTETDAKGKITYVNDQFCKTSKYSRAELIGKDHRNVANSGYHSKEFWKDFWTTIQSGKIWRGDVRNKAKDGAFYWEDTTIVPFLGKDGKPEKYLAIRANITERKLAEEEVLKSSQIKSEFTSMVSHELRTPLTIIKESIGILNDEIPGPLNPEQKNFLKIAGTNTDRLARLINDVLDFQKFDSQHMTMQLTQNNINQLVNDVRESFMLEARNNGLELSVELEDGLPLIFLDTDKITQVLTNFISNALKFTKNGKITLKTRRFAQNAIQVSVEDQGIGIKNEDIPKLFKPFSQLAKANERKTGTTGLGLAISKQIIEAHHNGKIGVESVFGQGTTFYFILPIKERRVRKQTFY